MLRKEEISNPLTVVSTDEAVNMTSTPTVEMSKTYLARIQDEIIRRPISVLEYG